MDQVSAEEIRKHVQALQGVRHPVAAPAALAVAGTYIREFLASLGYTLSLHSFPDSGSSYTNIIATRPGSLYPDQRVLVVAHYDTVATSPGADDNASGVAVLLEAARVLQPLRFGQTVQFVAVNLEETAGADGSGEGTRGSRALAIEAKQQGWDLAGVVVLESVAYAGPTAVQTAPDGLPFEVPETGDFIAIVANEQSEPLARKLTEVIERREIPLPYLSLVVPGNGEMLPDTRRSDHAPFWDNGFNAIMLTDTTNFRSPHYHLPSDTLETLNLDFAAVVGRAVAELVKEVAGGRHAA